MKPFFLFIAEMLILLSQCNKLLADASNTEQVMINSQNPLSDLFHFPFQNNFNFGFDHKNQPQLLTNIQPIIPVKLNHDIKLVLRPILPVLYQVDTWRPKKHVFGLGDFNPELFFTTTKGSKIMWGVGPAFLFPTATSKQLGSGTWSAGPALGFVAMPTHWVLGFLTNNVWSFTKKKKKNSVNLCTFQPFVFYNFFKSWFIVSAPTITASWNSPTPNRWVVPAGGGIGHVCKISEQTLSISFQAYYNVLTTQNLGPTWTARFNLDFLFP
ncbi:MAG: neuromedin U [Alphaproteobacteria bacterium]|nr:neuromedin U [Alphaproteobacteria bacterium]